MPLNECVWRHDLKQALARLPVLPLRLYGHGVEQGQQREGYFHRIQLQVEVLRQDWASGNAGSGGVWCFSATSLAGAWGVIFLVPCTFALERVQIGRSPRTESVSISLFAVSLIKTRR